MIDLKLHTFPVRALRVPASFLEVIVLISAKLRSPLRAVVWNEMVLSKPTHQCPTGSRPSFNWPAEDSRRPRKPGGCFWEWSVFLNRGLHMESSCIRMHETGLSADRTSKGTMVDILLIALWDNQALLHMLVHFVNVVTWKGYNTL